MELQFFSRVMLILAIIKITLAAPAAPTTKASTLDTIARTNPNSDELLAKNTEINADQENYLTHEQINGVSSELNKIKGGTRKDKMLGYFGYYPQPIAPFPTTFYPQPNYYDDYEQYDEEEDVMSRANRRRPQTNAQTENSPIYYIRLPPTPYMFVPGYGYISQPPRITPMNAYGPMNPMAAMQPIPSTPTLGVNPFINLPLNFLSNGKPTNIYQWGGNSLYQPNPYSQFGYPQRRPSYKPKTQYLAQDSKVHHLKGQYMFNGRPESIYVLGNSYNSIYPEPMQNYY